MNTQHLNTITGIADTPPISQPNYGVCGNPSSPSDNPTDITGYCGDTSANPLNCNSCSSDNPGMPWNYMDYSDDHCLSAFTEQQGWLALYYIVTARPSFASSSWEVLGGTACVAGQYHDGTSCQSCPANTYNTESNCTSGESCCESCPTGKFSASTGSRNEYACEYCELDKVANCQSRLSAGTLCSSVRSVRISLFFSFIYSEYTRTQVHWIATITRNMRIVRLHVGALVTATPSLRT